MKTLLTRGFGLLPSANRCRIMSPQTCIGNSRVPYNTKSARIVGPRLGGGVKVVEIHPGGHGLHFHWVIKGRIPIHTLLDISRPLGFGRIQVDDKPAGLATAGYLSTYLTKQKNKKLDGLRRWGCLGDYVGIRARDIEYLSPSVQVFREAFREAKSAGKPSGAAWVHAKNEQAKYNAYTSTHDENGPIPTH